VHKHTPPSTVHAGHAGLLRLKRHWRPISRQLQLSDSDDSSDSLSDFNSIADFHTEGETKHSLQHQHQYEQLRSEARDTDGGSRLCASDSSDSLAVAVSAESLQAAVCIKRPESTGNTGRTSRHVKTVATGRLSHSRPLIEQAHASGNSSL